MTSKSKYTLRSAVELAYSQYLPEEEWNKESSPLVILHCLCGSRGDWHTLSEKLAKLLKREVLTIDLRNHGESGHAPSMQYKEMVHDVITLLDKLNIAKAHFLGSSMGASVMMTLALLHPHRVHSLISEDTTPCKISGSLKSIIRGYLEVLASLDMSLPDGSLENLKERALPELEKVEQSRNNSLFFARNIIVSKGDSNTATCTFNLQAILKDLDHLTSWDETLAECQFTGPVCFLGGCDSINLP
ncbi:hypothetical protein EB796_012235 [Bugula neritina]|uniref:sn-1-specific diacylglycerol lipase ABHD11 n=1 Tax=Bugula neritina TaxID=10212 RepID=A0A7J7JVU8_BUGNE|nr:hypothetical protein EB796_012235 [Bugula neritina]